jgi:hypothetical protein
MAIGIPWNIQKTFNDFLRPVIGYTSHRKKRRAGLPFKARMSYLALKFSVEQTDNHYVPVLNSAGI